MLTKLNIQNYALIENLSIDFSSGLTTITGETGAGKSILLGGLGLVLGKRADTNTLLDTAKKCIIEAEFAITQYNLHSFFEKQDLDYEDNTIIRRELLPSGKSRAFINDTPVRLEVLTKLKNQLIDVHSQHQTLQLGDTNFQFEILDARANTSKYLQDFKKKHKHYKQLQTDLNQLKEELKKETQQHDYHLFLFEELEASNFKKGEQETLEETVEKMNNVELIQQNLSASHQYISSDETGVLQQLQQLKNNFEKIQSFDKSYQEIYQRLASIHIDFDDIESEISNLIEQVSFNPYELNQYNDRLQILYNLFQKHAVNQIDDLIAIQESLSEKVSRVVNSDNVLASKEEELQNKKQELFKLAAKISEKRKASIKILENDLLAIVQELGMPYAQFSIVLNPTEIFNENGIDSLQFLFTANKGGRLGEIKQVASGGELSRLMLAFKSIIAKYSQLPTIIFDEIDTGVSGEIALKMAIIMEQMAQKMQVVSITHLPQIAAIGTQQLKVYKQEKEQHSQTNIKLLSKDERIIEIAEMLGGKSITETALNHAKQLLG